MLSQSRKSPAARQAAPRLTSTAARRTPERRRPEGVRGGRTAAAGLLTLESDIPGMEKGC